MAIPARQIMAVNPRTLQAGGSELVFSCLVLSDNTLIPLSVQPLTFSSPASVAEYFGATSDEYKFAVNYFLGYTDSYKKPKAILFAARQRTARNAYIRGAKVTAKLAELKAITKGAIRMTVNGLLDEVASINLSSATSYSNIANLIQTALQTKFTGVKVSYSSLTGAFQIETNGTGVTQTIDFAVTPTTSGAIDLGDRLNLSEAKGAVLSNGCDARTAEDVLNEIIDRNQNWVTFTTLYEADDDEILSLASWAGGQGVNYLYIPWSNDALLEQASSTASIADKLEEANVSATTLVKGYKAGDTNNPYDLASFVSGAIASIDWNRLNATITLAFKRQLNLASQVETGTLAQTLLKKKCNFYGNYATRNDNFRWFYNSAMFGDYRFIDPYINAIWLDDALQVALMVAFRTYGRIPYTPEGYTLIRGALLDPINRAKRNGVIDIGLELSDLQRSELTREFGDSSAVTEIILNGYYLQITDPGAQARVGRTTPNITLAYSYGGAVHQIEMSSVEIL